MRRALFRVCVYETPLPTALNHIGKICLFSWVDFVSDEMENDIEPTKSKRNVLTRSAHYRYVLNPKACACVDFSPVCGTKALDFILLLWGNRNVPNGISKYDVFEPLTGILNIVFGCFIMPCQGNDDVIIVFACVKSIQILWESHIYLNIVLYNFGLFTSVPAFERKTTAKAKQKTKTMFRTGKINISKTKTNKIFLDKP